MLRPGDAAPDFVLKDHAGSDLRLSSRSGRPIVLFFYPKDGNPGCRIQARGLRDRFDDIQRHQATVVGVSLDDAESHAAFRKENALPFHLVSDRDGRVHDLYDAWRTTMFGRVWFAVRRCTYLIDSDGIIRQVYRNVNVFRHARQIVKDLDRIQAQDAWGKLPKKRG